MSGLGQHSDLTPIEIDIIVKKAVRETFVTLGADLSDNGSILALQKDFAHMRKQREGGEQTAEFLKRSAIGVFIAAFLWAMWQGFKVAVVAKGLS
jgi:hypothetical protein